MNITKYQTNPFCWEFKDFNDALEVAVGCAHNKCTFCNMYRDVKFSIAKEEQIEQDLQEAQRLYPQVRRLFLLNGDAFVLSVNRLKE